MVKLEYGEPTIVFISVIIVFNSHIGLPPSCFSTQFMQLVIGFCGQQSLFQSEPFVPKLA